MRKRIVATLCSAFVVPGLGQVLNGEVKKGIGIFIIVFILFILGSVRLVFLIRTVLDQSGAFPPSFRSAGEILQGQDLSGLGYILFGFSVIWLYSVVDAYWKGRKLEDPTGGNHEIISHG